MQAAVRDPEISNARKATEDRLSRPRRRTQIHEDMKASLHVETGLTDTQVHGRGLYERIEFHSTSEGLVKNYGPRKCSRELRYLRDRRLRGGGGNRRLRGRRHCDWREEVRARLEPPREA